MDWQVYDGVVGEVYPGEVPWRHSEVGQLVFGKIYSVQSSVCYVQSTETKNIGALSMISLTFLFGAITFPLF